MHLISLLLRKGLADNTLFISLSTPQLVYVTVVHYTNDVIALVKRTIIQKVDSFKTWPFVESSKCIFLLCFHKFEIQFA